MYTNTWFRGHCTIPQTLGTMVPEKSQPKNHL